MQGKPGVLKKRYLESAPQNPQVFQLITVNKTDIFGAKKMTDEFNNFFTNIGTDLANKIPNTSKAI